MATSMYAVEGLTCASCLAEVLESIRSLIGVTAVSMDLVPGGRSPLVVTSGATLRVEAMRVAVQSAGFHLTDVGAQDGRRRRDRSGIQGKETRPDRERMTSSIGGVSS